jgi:hypothetical protein
MLITNKIAAHLGRCSLFVTLSSGRDTLSTIPDFINIRVITINGKREGSTHFAHSAMPSKAQERYLSGNIIITAAKNSKHKKMSAYQNLRKFLYFIQ